MMLRPSVPNWPTKGCAKPDPGILFGLFAPDPGLGLKCTFSGPARFGLTTPVPLVFPAPSRRGSLSVTRVVPEPAQVFVAAFGRPALQITSVPAYKVTGNPD